MCRLLYLEYICRGERDDDDAALLCVRYLCEFKVNCTYTIKKLGCRVQGYIVSDDERRKLVSLICCAVINMNFGYERIKLFDRCCDVYYRIMRSM